MRDEAYAVLPDANVLFRRPLRDWICLTSLLSDERTHRVWTTEDILTEATYHYRRRYPAAAEANLSSIRRNVGAVATMITGYAINPERAVYRDFPDAHDLHLLEAAHRHQVDAVVTDDRSLLDWGSRHDDELSMELMSPDAFLLQLADHHPEVLLPALRHQHAYWSSKIRSGQIESINYVERLRSAGAPGFATRITPLLGHL